MSYSLSLTTLERKSIKLFLSQTENFLGGHQDSPQSRKNLGRNLGGGSRGLEKWSTNHIFNVYTEGMGWRRTYTSPIVCLDVFLKNHV